MKSIKLSIAQWKVIRAVLQEEYPKTVFLIRSKMRERLGFTVREHKDWTGSELVTTIHLDFYSENKRTMFLLKFSEYIR